MMGLNYFQLMTVISEKIDLSLTASILWARLGHVRQTDVAVGKANGSLGTVVAFTRISVLAWSELELNIVKTDALGQAC